MKNQKSTILRPRDKEFDFHPLNNEEGFILHNLSLITINEINSQVNNIKDNFKEATPHNRYLEGQIDNEYLVSPIPSLVMEIIHIFKKLNPNPFQLYEDNIFNKILKTQPATLSFSKMWINFQKKYEYNPIHQHNGLYSFVVWHHLPFFIENERDKGPGKNKSSINTNGCFSFNFKDYSSINSCVLEVDKTWEGVVAIFPSPLPHQVYPFYTSEDYRITVSGNILIDYTKKI